ncbi:MAG: thioredoxin domain-containing protein [Planctomycetia bacterium]|nr:thioredoxin domain-containing protein [Planctomycetia bacterium]
MAFLSSILICCTILCFASQAPAANVLGTEETTAQRVDVAERPFDRTVEKRPSSSHFPATQSNSVEVGVVLLDFYNDACGPCRAMMPIVDALAAKGYRISKVNTDQFPHWAQRFRVTQIPCFVVIINGKEHSRYVGATSLNKLEKMLTRAGGRPQNADTRLASAPSSHPMRTSGVSVTQVSATTQVSQAAQAAQAAQTSQAPQAAQSKSAWRGLENNVHVSQILDGSYVFPPLPPDQQLEHFNTLVQLRYGKEGAQEFLAARNTPPSGATVASESHASAAPVPATPVSVASGSAYVSPTPNSGAFPLEPIHEVSHEQKPQTPPPSFPMGTSSDFTSRSNPSLSELERKYLASTVRIHVRSGNAHGCGSGTIIDSRNGHALILTCGHLFRGFRSDDKISVDIFGANGLQGVEGKYIRHDENLDLGLISIPVTRPVEVTPVAARDTRFAKGMIIHTSGCTNGAVPTVRNGKITNINRYEGFPNIEVSDVPQEGRSGGGLFLDGRLVGVCMAANVEDKEGIYISLAGIHQYMGAIKFQNFANNPKNESLQLAERNNLRHQMPVEMPDAEPPIFLTDLPEAGGGSKASVPLKAAPTAALPSSTTATELGMPAVSNTAPNNTMPNSTAPNTASNIPTVPAASGALGTAQGSVESEAVPITRTALTGEPYPAWPPRWQ